MQAPYQQVFVRLKVTGVTIEFSTHDLFRRIGFSSCCTMIFVPSACMLSTQVLFLEAAASRMPANTADVAHLLKNTDARSPGVNSL